jgi:hypothetical protein
MGGCGPLGNPRKDGGGQHHRPGAADYPAGLGWNLVVTPVWAGGHAARASASRCEALAEPPDLIKAM